MIVSNLVCAISGLAIAVVPNYISILVLRTIFGLGFKGSWMSSYVFSNIHFHVIVNNTKYHNDGNVFDRYAAVIVREHLNITQR